MTEELSMWQSLASVMWKLLNSLDVVELLQEAIVAGFAVFLGALFVLRRIRKERAFDRRLDWHTTALRATSKYRRLSRDYWAMLTDQNNFLSAPERITELASELKDCASDLRDVNSDAVLFAEKRAVRQLGLTIVKIETVIGRARDAIDRPEAETGLDLSEDLRPLDELISEIHLNLVTNIRNQLGLDKLTGSDLGLGPEPSRSWLIGEYLLYRVPFVAKMFPRLFPQRREG